MKEVKNDIIKKFEYENYVVYVKDINNSCYEVYLQNENYGVIEFMYGTPKNDTKDFELMILEDIDDYIKLYQDRYED